jgi:hypothetical protein
VLQTLDPELFERVMGEYHRSRQSGDREIVICIDGKTLRGTILRVNWHVIVIN